MVALVGCTGRRTSVCATYSREQLTLEEANRLYVRLSHSLYKALGENLTFYFSGPLGIKGVGGRPNIAMYNEAQNSFEVMIVDNTSSTIVCRLKLVDLDEHDDGRRFTVKVGNRRYSMLMSATSTGHDLEINDFLMTVAKDDGEGKITDTHGTDAVLTPDSR